MGNCQAVDTATLVIQHPNGKVDKFYCPLAAREIMKMNPGHYVALLISTTLCPPKNDDDNSQIKKENKNQVRVTRIKLLRPTDTLVLGQAYRLISNQEVMKGFKDKKQGSMKKYQLESADRRDKSRDNNALESDILARNSEKDDKRVTKTEKHQTRTSRSINSAPVRSRTWQPSLKSISEAGS